MLVYYFRSRLGVDYNWDLQNYHLSSWTLLWRGGYFENISPGGLQSFLSPFVNGFAVAPYTAFGLTAGGWVIAMIHAVGFAISVSLLTFLPIRGTPVERFLTVVVAIYLTVTAAMPAGILGTSFEDNTIAVLLALAAWIALHGGFRQNFRRGILVAFVLSLAVSFKATACFFALAHGLAFYMVLISTTENRGGAIREFLLFGLCSVFFTLALSAPWMIEVYSQTGNPLFPFANNLFRSPFYYFSSFMDTQMLPKTFADFIAYPWTMAIGTAHTSEAPQTDSRYLIACIMLVVAGTWCTRSWMRGSLEKIDQATLFLAIYFLIAFLLWRTFSSVQRYFVFGDLLLAVLIVRVAAELPWRLMTPALLLVAGVHAMTVHFPEYGRRIPPGGIDQVLAEPPIVDDAFVILSEKPMGYAVGLFGASSRFTVIQPGAPGVDLDLSATGPFSGRVSKLIHAKFKDGVWIVLRRAPTDYVLGYLRKFDLSISSDCRDVETFAETLKLCRLATRSG
ncbi:MULTISPECIES: hypothetical protein [Rhodopseudomonas]|uniref:Glycosyltransferase RgtA/B/C/D-like domain-containing protein n=1 Tax=Rhodopseudomonas palustris TaxID=1076 RepID=A0A0D7F2J7_RHOPL|nr:MULTISPECIES: hypothetical protein [Rhodopseudomonas]KIZ47030.1 hypothetical protein OO17_05740 [Rhodopseudomonas palustris]MDF3813995.1 hypothetical protein [Rhodopseudomonas sp. BAL398]WOK19955.1 hypothetical protein RBJ75_10750 [Rhodopseudomonas sp. BAL398]